MYLSLQQKEKLLSAESSPAHRGDLPLLPDEMLHSRRLSNQLLLSPGRALEPGNAQR